MSQNDTSPCNKTDKGNYLFLGVSVVKTGEDLFGQERFAADGLATEKECEELISLAKVS